MRHEKVEEEKERMRGCVCDVLTFLRFSRICVFFSGFTARISVRFLSFVVSSFANTMNSGE